MPPVTHATRHDGRELSFVARLAVEQVLAVVRADVVPDAAQLCRALVRGGIRVVELTFTTPDVERNLREAAEFAASSEGAGTLVGAGTVLDARSAEIAVGAGAAFLVTPGVGRFAPGVVEVARAAAVPVLLGALTPSEVLEAVALGADAVKVFPASLGGPRHLTALHGPLPAVPLVPSGGVDADNAQAFLDAGATAVSAGTGVVPPAAVAAGDWDRISAAAQRFRAGLRSRSAATANDSAANHHARSGDDESESR